MKRALLILSAAFALSISAAADCIPFEQASKHMGSNECVTGKVLKVGHSARGTTFLDFCEDAKSCPFVVVIFARDLRDVGDVDKLEGKTIEISGKVEEYNGRAEIILKDVKQLHGEAGNIPPLPKNYDVEKRGGFSATSNLPRPKTAQQPKKPSQQQGGSADEE